MCRMVFTKALDTILKIHEYSAVVPPHFFKIILFIYNENNYTLLFLPSVTQNEQTMVKNGRRKQPLVQTFQAGPL